MVIFVRIAAYKAEVNACSAAPAAGAVEGTLPPAQADQDRVQVYLTQHPIKHVDNQS